MSRASDAPVRQSIVVGFARSTLIAAAVAAGVAVPHAQQRSDPSRSWLAAWEARQAQEAERRHVERIRRDYERRRAIAHARMRSNPETAYPSRLPPDAAAMCPVHADPEARREFQRRERQRREDAFRRATGLPLRTGYSVHPVPKRGRAVFSGGTASNPAMAATPHAASSVFAAASADSAAASGHRVPYFPPASDALGRQGFARVVNHSDEAGEVVIEAFDDEGASYGPLTLSIGASATVHFNSGDLENGNVGKGLTGSTGPGQGGWRLELDSAPDIEVLSYIRTGDGFLTTMHDTVPVADGRHEVAVFNPGSNRGQESLLRLVNMDDAEAVVAITGTDDRGQTPGDGATATIPAGASRTYTAAELEAGDADGLDGSIGDGSGKWRLVVESEQDISAMSLMSLESTGHLTNLSTVPDNEADGIHAVPLFPSASDGNGRQGFARVVNRSDEAGQVTIRAFDDTDVEYEALTLSVGANEAKHFNSDDLELGNAAKGLAGSTGAGEGDWRLELTSDLDIRVLSYVRTEDGFLTAMHDTVPQSVKRHRVAVFNPGSNANQRSLLRLVNAGGEDAQVTIVGFDGNGESPGSAVVVAVPAGSSTTLAAQDLETGSPDFEGALGDGAGKWSLTVTADRAVAAMSLLSSPTGHLTNLSTAPQRGAGPVETATEAFEALISPVVQSECVNCHYEGNTTGNMPVFVRDTDPDHMAKNLAQFEDYLAEESDGASKILDKIKGARGHGGGEVVAAGTDQYGHFERFLELLGAEIERLGVTVADLFEGVTFESPRRTLWRAAIVFAGRIPTGNEYASIEGGTDGDLRRAIRRLMDCPEDEPQHRCGFHEFLIRGGNDRLLTDRRLHDVLMGEGGDFYVDYTNKLYELSQEGRGGGGNRAYDAFRNAVHYAAGRAPLELIAYVVQNEMPYTDVLTAPYIMANPMAAEAYGAATEFDDTRDVHEFKPSEIVSYYRNDGSKVVEEVDGLTRIVEPGNQSTDYPHAGILNTHAFLNRYPTTATNRNRARSRWTYYHFLGDDIEKSAARTMRQEVLKDKNNPTMHNPACTVCHARMDPVAGAFQNYGDEAYYRSRDGGVDSLDGDYTVGAVNLHTLVVEGDSYESRQTFSPVAWLDSGSSLVLRHYGNNGCGDDGDQTCGRDLRIDEFLVRDMEGDIVDRIEWSELDERCEYDGAYNTGSDGNDDHYQWWGWGCHEIPVEVPESSNYMLEVTVWADQSGDETTSFKLGANLYQEGDTWYRDMREPGFDGEPVPGADNSLRWLAGRIVEDDRFARASVKFWWPSIMGSEVVEQPQEADDAVFDVVGKAADVQKQAVDELAAGFRRGFDWSDQGRYNLKDLLVEITLSDWFRAESLQDDDQDDDAVRRLVLRHGNAGARRLLTPEELSRKTVALTGFDWRRWKRESWEGPGVETNWTNTDWRYGLLYGGIDSDGITKRGRDMTSVMAGVAQRHASATACPVVMKDLYLLPEEDRRLLGGVDGSVTPTFEFGSVFEIEAASRDKIETLSLEGTLGAGDATVKFAFVNDFWDEEVGDRDVLLDRLTVYRGTTLVHELEMEDFEHLVDCDHVEQDALHLSGSGPECVLSVPVDIAQGGNHRIEIAAWGDQAGDDLPKLEVAVETDTERSAGARAIRGKLDELHENLLGVEAGDSSEDVQATFDLFVDVWRRGRNGGEGDYFRSLRCAWDDDAHYFDGIADELWRDELDEEGGRLGWDWDRVNAFFEDRDWSDTHHVARTWVVVLAYLMTDPRYLHL